MLLPHGTRRGGVVGCLESWPDSSVQSMEDLRSRTPPLVKRRACRRKISIICTDLSEQITSRLNTRSALSFFSPSRVHIVGGSARLMRRLPTLATLTLAIDGHSPRGRVHPYTADAELARRLATAAGDVLLAVRAAESTADQRALRTAGDRAAQQYLSDQLAAERPGDAVLSEEAADDRRRLDAARVWIIDPLDGTREYAEGRDDWAVHVALWTNDAGDPWSDTGDARAHGYGGLAGGLAVGAIALPGLSRTLATSIPTAPPARDGRRLRIAVSRTRAPAVARVAAEQLDAELIPMGSAGYKTAAVVLGKVDAYVHAGGQYEWDSAAPVAVARAAGLHASRLDGSPLVYNRPDPYLPDLLVCRPELAAQLLSICAPATR